MAHRQVELSTKQLDQLVALYAQNLSDEDVATYFGVHRKALHRWIRRRENSEIRQRIEQAKVMAKARIRESVFRKGTGHPYREGRPKVIVDGKVIDDGEPAQAAVPGNLDAAKYWQANNDEWRDVKQIEASGPKGEPLGLQVPHMSTRELANYVLTALKEGIVKADGLLPKPPQNGTQSPQRADVRAIDADYTIEPPISQ